MSLPLKIQNGIGNKEKYIVDADSAKLGAPREVTLQLDRNHSDISKFLGPGDDGYELVKGKLQIMDKIIQGLEVKCTKCNDSSEARTSLTLERLLSNCPEQNEIWLLMSDTADANLRNV